MIFYKSTHRSDHFFSTTADSLISKTLKPGTVQTFVCRSSNLTGIFARLKQLIHALYAVT